MKGYEPDGPVTATVHLLPPDRIAGFRTAMFELDTDEGTPVCGADSSGGFGGDAIYLWYVDPETGERHTGVVSAQELLADWLTYRRALPEAVEALRR